MMEECRSLVLIRLPVHQTQRCRNSLTKDLSLIENYHGRVCGIGESVAVKEGNSWPCSTCLAVLEFESTWYANKWFESTPSVKQADWLTGVDIIRVPLRTGAPGQNYITITELDGASQSSVEASYSAANQSSLGKCGATQVVMTGPVANYRGSWEPGHLEVTAWTTEEEAKDWLACGDHQELHTLRHQICKPSIVGCYLCPLKTDWNYHSPW